MPRVCVCVQMHTHICVCLWFFVLFFFFTLRSWVYDLAFLFSQRLIRSPYTSLALWDSCSASFNGSTGATFRSLFCVKQFIPAILHMLWGLSFHLQMVHQSVQLNFFSVRENFQQCLKQWIFLPTNNQVIWAKLHTTRWRIDYHE